MTISPVSPRSPLESKSAIKEEIALIWSQVQARVIELAGGDANRIRQNLTIDNVLAHLDQVLEDSSPKESAIRSTLDTTLKFIDTVGGVVAGGASEVFGPAELCFNAVSLVIHAWQGYQDVFESLAGLLDKCSQYLSRLEYYIRGGMDARLAKVACQHLQLFVEICDRTIKLRNSKRRKLKVFSKFFFLNDNDIQDLLDKMDSLVDREGRLVSAQTFRFASQAAVGAKENLAISKAVNSKIDLLIANRSDQLKETDAQRRRDLILKKLAFDENKLDRERHEPDPFWQRAYQNFRRLVVPGTGQWCFSEPLFVAWERDQEKSPPILGIEGVEGSGKSYLASTIIRRLRNRSSVESCGSRTLLAFYFLEGDSKEELKRTNHLDLIIKSLVWQFTQADASYLRLAAGVCEETSDLDPHEIPERFLFNKDLARVIDATFFIVIDGIGDIIGDGLMKFLRRVSTLTADHQRVRVLLTGRPRAFEQLATVKGMSFEKMSISARNRSDVEKYTHSRMDHIEALKDTSRMGIPELRQKICDSLCEKTAGDYFRINTILKHISTLDYVHDIDQVLEDAGKERCEQIQGEIEKLNQTLSSKEIAEVNEIILWILYGREWFKPRQMTAVLYQKSGDLSLLPLGTKLQIKYSLFEVDSDGDIDFRSYEIAELIPERRQTLDSDGEISTPSATKKVNTSEVTIVRHFLNTVCPPDLYDRFGFEPFFEQKLRGKGDYIYRDDKDVAEVKLAVTCLRVLTEQRDGRREILRPYAVSYVLQHLSSVDLAFIDREWKTAVGPRLLKLFTDEASTDALLWTDDLETAATFAWHARSAWLESDEGLTEILRWFRDSAVVSSIPEHQGRAWISNLVSSPSPQMDLLQSFVRRMAVHWLREASPQPLACNAFSFLFDSMRKMEHGERCEEHSKAPDHLNPTVESILKVENWSRKLLEIKETDSLWELQVATVLQNFSFKVEAQNRCRRALELDATNWRASYYLARSVESDETAIHILEDVSARLQVDSEWMQDSFHRKALAEMLFDLGQRYWSLGKFDLATKSYTRSIETNYTGYDRALGILEQYHSRSRWSDIVTFLGTIQDTSDTQSLSDMLVNLATKDTVHEIILQTAIETDQFNLLEQMYDDAIQLASETQAYTSLYYIRYHLANALSQEAENEERAIALWEIALKDDLPRSFLDVEDILPSLTIKLAPVYLRRARAAEQDSDMARDYLRRISEILPDEVAENKILFPAKLYLSRYYQVKGDQAKAKQIARSVVEISLEILSDDDKNNDYLAYWRLLLVFLPLDDDRNASAAVIMAALASQSSVDTNTGREEALVEDLQDTIEPENTEQETPDQSQTEKSHSKATPPIDTTVSNLPRQGTHAEPDPSHTPISTSAGTDPASNLSSSTDHFSPPPPQIFAVCDGECGHYWETASEMWWCKDCINLTFDRGCFEKLQKGTLPLNICDKSHEFLVIPKWDEDKMRKIPRGFVPYDGRAISLEEWKGVIRKMYVELDD